MRIASSLSTFPLLFLVVVSASPAAASSHVRTGDLQLDSRVKNLHRRYKRVGELKSRAHDDLLQRITSISGGASDIPSSNGVYGVLAMALIETATKKFLQANSIKFPSQLGGCILLFFVSILVQVIRPGWGDCIFESLSPGATLIAKWLPVFFVPGLAMLPLAPSIGSGKEIGKALLVVIIGFVYTLSTVSFSVLALRKTQGAKNYAPPSPVVSKRVTKTSSAPKQFQAETMSFFAIATAVSVAISIGATRMNLDFVLCIQAIALLFSTFAGFVYGSRLPASITKVVHPLVTSTAITLAVVQILALGVESNFLDVLRDYKVGALDPMTIGAGDFLLWLLGPAVVSFAISMYGKKKLLQENLLVVLSAVIVSSVGGLYGTAAFVRAISLGGSNGRIVRLSLVARNVTTALSMAITSMLDGDISIAATAVVLTGIIGGTFGRSLMTAMGIHDPVTRGLGIGSAAQGLGVASIVSETDAFPFAAIAMVLTAIVSTTLVSIPVTKDALVKLATGA